MKTLNALPGSLISNDTKYDIYHRCGTAIREQVAEAVKRGEVAVTRQYAVVKDIEDRVHVAIFGGI